jgi:hypothetical protein
VNRLEASVDSCEEGVVGIPSGRCGMMKLRGQVFSQFPWNLKYVCEIVYHIFIAVKNKLHIN